MRLASFLVIAAVMSVSMLVGFDRPVSAPVQEQPVEQPVDEQATLRQMKRDVARRVVAGEISLADAGAAFKNLHQSDVNHTARMQEAYPLACEHELEAREVMAEVELLLQERPEHAGVVRQRLNDELRGTSL